jgi:hypothetical protein
MVLTKKRVTVRSGDISWSRELHDARSTLLSLDLMEHYLGEVADAEMTPMTWMMVFAEYMGR